MNRPNLKILYVSLSVVIVDQITKLLIRGITIHSLGIKIAGMQLYSSKPVIGNFLRLTYIENPGMAFGIDFGWKSSLAIFSILASIAIFLYLYKARGESGIVRFSLALILGGAMGNLIDRVFYGFLFDGTALFNGRVIDFIDFDFFNISILGYNFTRFPVFNVADATVTVGVIILLIFHKRTSEADSLIQDGNKTEFAGGKLKDDPPGESDGRASETASSAKG
jgi:signal peptidase II